MKVITLLCIGVQERKKRAGEGIASMILPCFNCFTSSKQFKDITGATASVVENCIPNFSLKVLEEVIENVHLIFLLKFPAKFGITVREMSYRKCLSTDEKPKNFSGLDENFASLDNLIKKKKRVRRGRGMQYPN